MIPIVSLLLMLFLWSFAAIGGLTLLAIKLGWLPGASEQWNEIKRLKIYVAISTIGAIFDYFDLLTEIAQPSLIMSLAGGAVVGAPAGIYFMNKIWRQNGYEENGKESN